MPNHITNVITLNSEKEIISKLIEKFSTNIPSKPGKSFDGDIRYKDKDGAYGFYNKDKNIFSINRVKSKGIPEGWEVDMEDAFTILPDMNKVFPMPEIFDKIGEIHHGIVTAVKAKMESPISGNLLLAGLQVQSRSKAAERFDDPKEQAKFELACKAYKETGYCYWYDWQCANWGTKWNSYQCEIISDNSFSFQTAWSSIPKVFLEISSQFPEIEIEYKYADEDTGSNCGILKFLNGKMINEYLPESCSNEAYELSLSINTDHKKYFRKNNGVWESFDEEE